MPHFEISRVLFVAFWNSISDCAGQARGCGLANFCCIRWPINPFEGQRDIAHIVAGELLGSLCREPDELCYGDFFTVLCLAGNNREHSVFRFAYRRSVLDLSRQRRLADFVSYMRDTLHGDSTLAGSFSS